MALHVTSRSLALFVALLLVSGSNVDAGTSIVSVDSTYGSPSVPIDTTSPAQVSSGPQIGDTLWQDIKDVGTDFIDVFSRPAQWTGTEWMMFGGGAALVGTMGGLDASLRNSAIGERSPIRNELAEWGNTMGRVIPGAIIAATLYTGGLVLDFPGVRRAGRHVFQSAVYAGLVTMSVKAILGRHRPFLGDGPYVFQGFSTNDDFNSFPSGHSTMAFSVASTLSADIDHPAATIILYGLASVTAWSRMYDDRHWGSDVVAGAIVGTVIGHAVATLDDPDDPSQTTGSLRVFPTLNGFALTMMW